MKFNFAWGSYSNYLGTRWLMAVLPFWLFGSQVQAEREVMYQIERYAKWADKAMENHGDDVLYSIFLNDVDGYLPHKIHIQRAITRQVDRRILPGKTWLQLARHMVFTLDDTIRHAEPRNLFGSLKEEIPYTYVVSKRNLFFTESTHFPVEEKYKDRMSKHYFISGFKSHVHYAGEFHVFKNPERDEVFVVFDNASGTYRPFTEDLSFLRNLFEANFGQGERGLYFVTKSFEQKIDKQKLFSHDPYPYL